VKFLVDECLSPGLAIRLSAAGHDSVHALDRGLQGRPDAEVMSVAQSEGRALVTADTDFGELLVTNETIVPSLILIRGWTGGAGAQASLILSNLFGIEDDLNGGAIVVIMNDRIRVRRLGADSDPL
jgi:predicted nuclease of predicted toxin-antitoxin system